MNAMGQIGGARAGWAMRVAAPIWHRLLDRIGAGLIAGAIDARLPDGTRRRVGGSGDGPLAIVTVVRWRALWRLITGGSAGWYEAWEAGDWTSPDPVPLFDLFMRNRLTLGEVARAGGTTRLAVRAWHWLRRNHRDGARRNIAFHYDLGNDFYREWLDPGLTYSSAMFDHAGEPIERAQQRKLDTILARTATGAGDRIVEIGCGWGSFAETAARGGRRVHAITLSTEQQRMVDQRIADAGLDGVVATLTDYRDLSGTYDAVVSIEMVEAVGAEYWPAYLATIARVLKPGGRAAIQFIAIDDAIYESYARNVDFIQRHVFPGGMLLSETRFRALAEDCGLEWRDRVAFGQDYSETLRIWRERFELAIREGRLPTHFDARFIRMWRYYLMYCEGGFRGGGIDVVQVTLVKSD